MRLGAAATRDALGTLEAALEAEETSLGESGFRKLRLLNSRR